MPKTPEATRYRLLDHNPVPIVNRPSTAAQYAQARRPFGPNRCSSVVLIRIRRMPIAEKPTASASMQATTKAKTRLLRRKPQGREIGSDDRNSGEPARLDRFAVIGFR